jgi:hypothetical protein
LSLFSLSLFFFALMVHCMFIPKYLFILPFYWHMGYLSFEVTSNASVKMLVSVFSWPYSLIFLKYSIVITVELLDRKLATCFTLGDIYWKHFWISCNYCKQHQLSLNLCIPSYTCKILGVLSLCPQISAPT